MNILVLNCGSSSIKYQLLHIDKEATLLAKGMVDRVGMENSELEYKVPNKFERVFKEPIENHTQGINRILSVLVDGDDAILTSLSQLNAVGHRVAHGGERFAKSVLVNSDVKQGIRDCIELAPLHNPANLAGIEAIESILPNIPQIAVFDTAFHQSMTKEAFLYGIPYEYYQKYGIRRYGFHGTSHKYVAQKACKQLGLCFNSTKIITCHLGNGASIAAINNGKSIDTSMGFTPNEGLMMGTRSGTIDPGILPFIASKENKSLEELNNLINKESGVKGASGVSSDMRDLADSAQGGNADAKLALDMYAQRVKKYIGAYIAELNGLDLLIFTGGIGENNQYVRDLCLSNLNFLGIDYDAEQNFAVRGKDTLLSKPDSKVTVMAITTNEELVIAQETFLITQKLKYQEKVSH